MQRFVYLIILAVVLLLFKAFFLDEYLENRAKENNVSVEAVPEEPASMVKAENNISAKHSTKSFEEKMNDTPLDRLGESIAKKLENKL